MVLETWWQACCRGFPSTYQPLFTAFWPAAVQSRVVYPGGSDAKLIVVDGANRGKLEEYPNCPPVLTLRRGAAAREGEGDFEAEMVAQPANLVEGRLLELIDAISSLDFSNANVSGRRTRPSSAFQWYAGSGLLVIWRGSRHARAITFGFP